jgi:hypothetical protein
LDYQWGIVDFDHLIAPIERILSARGASPLFAHAQDRFFCSRRRQKNAGYFRPSNRPHFGDHGEILAHPPKKPRARLFF